ncbi:MAG: DUF5080 family protein [Staphylococcus haemolyticus]|uniref:DUF5080 family protein n=1 Tax=Staphylococcus TaxID=1279 RepID=UPI00069E3CED|nr:MULTISPECIES: DUF5080 family protein [Staphylococcus]KAA2274406.1 DUF5080 family protein [Staphylococcus sp. GDX7P312P]KAA2280724.1 DUF5080 family protein [Staphylococcus sp. GDX7P459A]MCE4954505.1 DUF5080 family protein [Staphylococcus haemolyticus]PTL04758.1 DUF5080 domain-containing protein [Staphylococcus haemolyticus]PTL14984.1 DUF5080 domain-containing protein [Staphylococcus haemolyticus]
MVYFVLIGVFIIFYLALFDSLLKSENFSILSIFLDFVIVIMLIIFHFIGNKLTGNNLSNYVAFTLIGSFVYMYYAIKNFWTKPKVLNYLINKEENVNQEDIEYQKLDLQISKIKSVYYFLIAVVLLILTKIHIVSEIKEDILSMNPVFIFLGMIIIVIWLIMDLYRKKKYGIFLFKSLIPIVVTIWIIMSSVLLY